MEEVASHHSGAVGRPLPGLNVLAMPIGPICDLDCAYCYYLKKKDLYPGNHRWAMSDETLEAFIRQYIAAQPPGMPEVVFGWQGGEPTLLPLRFFEALVELQRKHAPARVRCTNTLQTNGISLDDAWCRFLRENGFLVGISLDGPAHLHDAFRVDRSGRPTHARAMAGLKCLQKHGVDNNALCVVNRLNAYHPREVYGFLRGSDVEFIQFIPLVEPASSDRRLAPAANPAEAVSSRSVLPEQFGDFLIAVFEQWRRGDVGRVFVQTFDQALSAWMGIEPSLCIFQRECGRALALEHNGDVYSCDHFVNPQHRLGNIHQSSLTLLSELPQQIAFGRSKFTSLPAYCRRCEYLFACHGECPKNRLLLSPDGEPGLNYLCAGYKMFFRHVKPFMESMVRQIHDAHRLRSHAAVTQEV